VPVIEPGLLVTVYDVIVPAGGVNATLTDVELTTVAVTAVGADGGEAVVTNIVEGPVETLLP
jgi:hypothetical protein